MKKVKSLRMKNELFYSLKKLKGILNYIIIITGDTVKCGVNIVIYATHTLNVVNSNMNRSCECYPSILWLKWKAPTKGKGKQN